MGVVPFVAVRVGKQNVIRAVAQREQTFVTGLVGDALTQYEFSHKYRGVGFYIAV